MTESSQEILNREIALLFVVKDRLLVAAARTGKPDMKSKIMDWAHLAEEAFVLEYDIHRVKPEIRDAGDSERGKKLREHLEAQVARQSKRLSEIRPILANLEKELAIAP